MITLCVPCAGLGSRFVKAGYTTHPKPLIEVGGRPMISWVLSNFKSIEKDINLVLIVQKEHNEKFNFKNIVEAEFNFGAVNIVEIDGITDGALRTIVKGEEYFLPGPLICYNSDQWAQDFCPVDFLNNAYGKDGSIVTFKDFDPKWSFADIDEKGNVLRVAEKIPISNNATLGMYYFSDSKEFSSAAKMMFKYNFRHNGEFYLCPIFNLYCMAGRKVNIYEIEKSKAWGLGTPEDLEKFKKEYLEEL